MVHALGGRPMEALAVLREAFARGASRKIASDDEDLTVLARMPEFLELVTAK
jgi:hypothetical protein